MFAFKNKRMSIVPILLVLVANPGAFALLDIDINAYCSYILRVDCSHSPHKAVCGSDGVKYRNKCSLYQAHCRNSTIQQTSNDRCVDATTTLAPTHAPLTFPKSACEQIRLTGQCVKTGPEICGSNGVTYADMCDFAYAFCIDATIHKAHDGHCTDGKSTPDPGHNLALLDQFCKDIINVQCDDRRPTVCGSDGIIYTNICHLSKAHCKNTTIYKAHDDFCVHGATTKDPLHGPFAVLDSFCLYIHGAHCGTKGPKVCGSDGIPYTNMCDLARAHCQNSTIQQAHDDHCGVSSTPDPIDSSVALIDDICHKLPSMSCGSQGQTICGSNGVTYANMCEYFKAHCAQPGLSHGANCTM